MRNSACLAPAVCSRTQGAIFDAAGSCAVGELNGGDGSMAHSAMATAADETTRQVMGRSIPDKTMSLYPIQGVNLGLIESFCEKLTKLRKPWASTNRGRG